MPHLNNKFLWLAVGALVGVPLALSAPNDWAEGINDDATGATRDYYNRAGMLE